MINMVWLKTFCVLADKKHFTQTAEHLHMTQSGVSQHVKKLEEALKSELLLREGKGFTLTESGQLLLAEAEELLEKLDGIELKIKSDPEFAGEVRLMSPGSVGTLLYPELLCLQQSHPELVFDYRFAPNDDIQQALIEDKIDIGLATIPIDTEWVISKHVASEPLLLVTPSTVQHVDWESLQALGFINHPDGEHHARQLLSKNFPEFEHISQLKQSGRINQIHLILEPVSKGLGFTVLPQHAVKAFQSQDLITAYELSIPVSEALYLCQRRNKVLPNRVKNIISEINTLLSA